MSDPAIPGFAYYGNASGFDIWENLYYIPLGFSYDYYITRSEYNALSEGSENAIGDRELALLRALVVEDDRAQYYDGILQHLPEDQRVFNEENYLQDCLDRAERCCSSFEYTNTGFSAQIDSNRKQVVFFSVPYEAVSYTHLDVYKRQGNGHPIGGGFVQQLFQHGEKPVNAVGVVPCLGGEQLDAVKRPVQYAVAI